METEWEKNPAIKNFRDYLKIQSVHPNINYKKCVDFLKSQAASLGLPAKVYESGPNKPVVIITWQGKEPNLPAILLNSHMDVVPVFESSWTYPPFSAHIDKDGKIFARGSQDTKCIGIQYLEAIRNLKAAGVQLRRTVHISFVPEEEIDGPYGMKKFTQTSDFTALNIGFALDEGMASPNSDYLLYYGERSIWHIIVHCPGHPGHGSLLLPNTAGEKLRVVIDKFMDFRASEKAKLDSNPELTIGDVTSVNLTQLKGGIQSNVVPGVFTAAFDIRLAVDVNQKQFEDKLKQWFTEAGEGIYYEFVEKSEHVKPTELDASNKYWIAFKEASDKLGINLKCRIYPAATDSHYVRETGLPALGFSPMSNMPVLMHDHDEFLQADTFLRGITIYETLITAVANV